MFVFYSDIKQGDKMKISQISPTFFYNQNKNNTPNNNLNKKSLRAFSGLPLFGANKIKNMQKAALNSDLSIFSAKELEKLRKKVVLEIDDIINSSMTSGLSKRLDNLLHSPFVDYQTEYIHGGINLTDRITHFTDKKATESYKQFVLTSLSDTMPIDILAGVKDMAIPERNSAVKTYLKSYSKLDESSSVATNIRKMVKRFKEAGINIADKDTYLAESILSAQPLMSKNYIDLFKISPAQNVKVIKESKFYYNPQYFGELCTAFEQPKIFYDGMEKSKFFVVNQGNVAKLENSDYFKYDNNTEFKTLYELSGLSENKNIKELFDIIHYLKSKAGEIVNLDRKTSKNTNTFTFFLEKAEKYHPELNSLEFIEKYIKSLDSYKEQPLSDLLKQFPNSFFMNKKTIQDISEKIRILEKQPSAENKQEIEFLTKLHSFITNYFA